MFCKFCGGEISDNQLFCGSCGNKIEEKSIRINNELRENSASRLYLISCPSCGQAISHQAELCPHCGYKTTVGLEKEKKQQGLKWEGQARVFLIISIIIWGIGMILLCDSLPMIMSEISRGRYTYAPPFTSHEMDNLTTLFASILMFSIGFGLDIGVVIRSRKNQDK